MAQYFPASTDNESIITNPHGQMMSDNSLDISTEGQ